VIDELKSHPDGLVFLGSAAVALVMFLCLVSPIWTASLPYDAPETVISERVRIPSGRNYRYVSYIEVRGWGRYRCSGASRAREGTVVQYDPSFPSRCRRPEDRWRFVGLERVFFAGFVLALFGMGYAVIAFFFLSGDGRRSTPVS
jgi:hypothetical protein